MTMIGSATATGGLAQGVHIGDRDVGATDGGPDRLERRRGAPDIEDDGNVRMRKVRRCD